MNEYMKIAKELSEDNLRTNAGGPFGACVVKKVYYGNTKEDAAEIGFRDEYIYNFIKKQNDEVLKLICIDRDETIKAFKEFTKKDDKTIY